MASWTPWTQFEQTLGDSEQQGSLMYAVYEVEKSWAWLSHCTTNAQKKLGWAI